MKLNNIPILYKVLGLLIALGVVSIFATVFSSDKLIELDEKYSNLTDDDFPALIAIARSNRAIAQASGAAYATVAFTDAASMEGATKVFADFNSRVTAQLETAIARRPASAERYSDFKARWQQISKDLEKAVDLGT